MIAQDASPDRFWTAGKVTHAAGSATVAASDPRPLWMAMNALEREYGWVIDFDDPIWTESDTTAQNNPVWDAQHPGNPSRMPSGTSFQSTYAEGPDTSRSPVIVVTKVVQDYNASDNPGRFEVRRSPSGRIGIIGAPRDPSQTHVDVLDTRVSFPSEPLGSLGALDKLVKLLSAASGVKIVLGSIPYNLLGSASTKAPQGSVPARDILASIAESTDMPLMWDLLYDYDSRSYFLNLRPSVVVVTDETGKSSIVLQTQPKHSEKPR
jgi:hypothetical protein